MAEKRPGGVIVIGILTILGGLASLLIGLIAGIGVAFAGKMVGVVVPVLVIFGLVMLIIGVLRIISGIGLFALKEWARKLAVWMAVVDIVINILGMVHVGGFRISISGGIISIIIAAVVIWYLSKGSTMDAFSLSAE
jgi:uncharacterized membrane protein (DUF2068 family)